MPHISRNILVVDDHADTLRILVKLLSALGHQVWPAASCSEARQIAEAKEWAFDLMLCDVGLPDGDGAELMAEFKQRCGCYTIALTGYGMADDLIRYDEKQIDYCLIKPIALDKLQAAISR